MRKREILCNIYPNDTILRDVEFIQFLQCLKIIFFLCFMEKEKFPPQKIVKDVGGEEKEEVDEK